MKNVLLLLLVLSSCIPVINSKPNVPSPTISQKVSLSITPTMIKDSRDFQRVYDPSKWSLIYNKDAVMRIAISPLNQIWIIAESGNVAYQDGKNWKTFSKGEYGLTDTPSDMAIASDGTVWISGSKEVSHFLNGRWQSFSIPNVNGTATTRIAVDSSNSLWVVQSLCFCAKSIMRFDGNHWQDFSINGRTMEVSQLLFDRTGNLWASFGWPEGLGRYDGKNWHIFSGNDLWPQGPLMSIGMSAGRDGSIWAILYDENWIIRINPNMTVTKIPFDPNLQVQTEILTMFTDKKSILWVNAYLMNQTGTGYYDSGLVYFDGSRWVSFIELPFKKALSITSDQNGDMLIGTEKGLYRYSE